MVATTSQDISWIKTRITPQTTIKIGFTPLAESLPSKQFHPNLFKATEIP